MFKTKIFLLIIVLVSISGAISLAFFTTKGSGFLAKFALTKYVGANNVEIKTIKGTLARGLLLKDVELKDIKGIPPDSVLKIQELKVSFDSFDPSGLTVEIFNGRFRFPASDPIVFYGTYKNGSLDLKASTRSVNVRHALDLFVKNETVKKIDGIVNDVNVAIAGSFLEPSLEGYLVIEKLSQDGFLMSKCPLAFDVTLKDIKGMLKVYGAAELESGKVSGQKTAVVNLEKSKIIFGGLPNEPLFDVRGQSIVEKTKIKIALKGTIEKPDLKLSSEPPFPEERLLVMLATGKSWQKTEVAATQGKLSPAVAGDFLDYFIFGGSGSQLAEKFGITDFSVKYEDSTKGVEVKKSLSDKIEAIYGVEQTTAKEGQVETFQKVGGEYAVTDSISVGAEKEIKQQQDKIDASDAESTSDDKVYLKFKKQF
ncbi:translocation/assembly module TamB domain-containing protein [Candidatus Omnitrophota bacterium]